MFPILHFICFESQKYSSPLAICLWFDYEAFIPIFLRAVLNLLPKLWIVVREKPSLGKKSVFLWKFFPHFHKAYAQQILPGQDVDARKMTDLLEKMHFDESVGLDHAVSPEYIPVSLLGAVLKCPIEFFGNVSNYFILGHYVSPHVLLRLMIMPLFFGLTLRQGSITGIILLLRFSFDLSSSEDDSSLPNIIYFNHLLTYNHPLHFKYFFLSSTDSFPFHRTNSPSFLYSKSSSYGAQSNRLSPAKVISRCAKFPETRSSFLMRAGKLILCYFASTLRVVASSPTLSY